MGHGAFFLQCAAHARAVYVARCMLVLYIYIYVSTIACMQRVTSGIEVVDLPPSNRGMP